MGTAIDLGHWEDAKEITERLIREANMTLKLQQNNLELINKEIKKLPPLKKHKIKKNPIVTQ